MTLLVLVAICILWSTSTRTILGTNVAGAAYASTSTMEKVAGAWGSSMLGGSWCIRLMKTLTRRIQVSSCDGREM